MAEQKVIFHSKVEYPIAVGCCPEVYVCLGDTASGYTVDGETRILATVDNVYRDLGILDADEHNVRCLPIMQYRLTYDDAQFVIDQGTGENYRLLCSDIVELMPYVCTVDSILNTIAQPAMLCLDPVSDFPLDGPDVRQGCMVNLQGHATQPDGLYTYNSAGQWQMLQQLEP